MSPRRVTLTRLAVHAARAERAVELRAARAMWRRGWRVRILGHVGYGAAGPQGWVRVLGRVHLAPAPPPAPATDPPGHVRGWRQFVSINLAGVPVRISVGGVDHVVRSDVEGYLDATLPAELPPGWHEVALECAHGPRVSAPVRIVGPDETRGIVSDIDDTVMITALPRPLLAFWNTFVRLETSRVPVPGMADLLQRLAGPAGPAAPQSLVVYVSTGAWNVAPSVRRFLDRHGYPPGPLLLTDWGPTEERWFRSGRAHKHATLRRLLRELPGLTWTLVGDDGQHDPALYDELATEAPGRVQLVAIRTLSAAEQVLTHGTPAALPGEAGHLAPRGGAAAPVVRGRDGWELLERFPARG